ncbi:hypothetical protein N7509_006679 [Penicillium cosmopolitanum]|uniref:Cofilin n=1 Tax=Penicillium cosmopolitanum TaxID=1131564 RepID=A0A9X0B7N7_9EURO|nr:uncharacterized protein N7509_006679 [Penicillium cosmopolitanum]KAJ5391189.1 hypothetical protein N7509_006679 [Penicillium cosmopolitanum]
MGFTGVSFHLGMSSSKAGSSCEDSLLSLESKSVNIPTECITAYTQLHNKRGANKPSFLIYKISDDKRSIEVEESSTERNYEAFLQKLASSVDREGNPAPRYAVYDVEYDLKGDGKRFGIIVTNVVGATRATTVFISWVPEETSTRSRMLYAATKEQLRRILDFKVSIHADELSGIEWMRVVREASGGRLQG